MTKKIYPLYEWLFKAKRIIKEKWQTQKRVFIFIAWGSASGKTSNVANRIAKFFKNDSVVVSMDNYYMWAEYVKSNNFTFDQPEAINITLLKKHLNVLKRWRKVMIPSYDFVNSIPIPDSIEVEAKRLIIVEWLFTLHEEFLSISDLNLFVETSKNGRLIRRILRDIKRTRQKVSDIIDVFKNVVNPMHEKYIEPQKKVSDIIIRNEFDPYLELRWFDLDKFIKENNIPYLT